MKTLDLSEALGRGDFFIHWGEIARCVLRHPAKLNCRTGKMLVTIEGDSRDHELESGGSLLLPSRKLVIVEGNAIFSTTAPDTEPRRIRATSSQAQWTNRADLYWIRWYIGS